MHSRTMSAGTEAPSARSTTYSISLNGTRNKDKYKDLMDTSMTVDLEVDDDEGTKGTRAESPTKNGDTTIADSSCEMSQTDIGTKAAAAEEIVTEPMIELETEPSTLQNENDDVDMDISQQPCSANGTPLPAADLTQTIEFSDDDYFQCSLVELGRRLWKSAVDKQCYTKGCLWSPDGTCILVPVHMDGMHVIELPRDLYKLYTEETVSTKRPTCKLGTAVHVKEGGMVYDCVWYPFMNSNAPETCCWLASRQHEPIHMWDAFTGELRCTYRGYNNVDEVESAIAITFSNDGDKVLGGYKKSIKLFDTNVPGRDTTSIPVKQAISCFALTTDNDSTVTTGSWNGFVNHYDLRIPKVGPLFTLGGHTGGITFLRYAPLANGDSWSLFSGARVDNKILEWDMRNYLEPVRTYTRTVATNQRIYFDLSPHEQRWLVSGDTEGKLRIWDLRNNVEESLPLHDDCCNGVNFHPDLPILATSSGQYHCVGSSSEDEDFPRKNKSTKCERNEDGVVNYENALILWWLGKSSAD